MNNPRIILVAGRSGGHILPALTLANQYKKNTPSAEIFFISTATPLDFSLLKTHPLITKHIPFNLGNIPSRIIHYPLYIAQLCKFFIKSLFILKRTTPEKIISTGGYVALPVCIAAWFLRIPVELYELNAVPGKTIELLARFATTTFTPFTSAQKKLARYNCTINPYPLKFTESDKISQKKALESLTLSQDKKTLLIVGGSQGSSFINEAIRTWLQEDESLHHKLQIIHQTGSNAIDDYQLFYHKKKYPPMYLIIMII